MRQKTSEMGGKHIALVIIQGKVKGLKYKTNEKKIQMQTLQPLTNKKNNHHQNKCTNLNL